MSMHVKYIGNLQCESSHPKTTAILKNGSTFDNNDKEGIAFSPVDLIAVAAGQCALLTVAIAGKDKGINIDGASCEVEKTMSTDKPSRMVELKIHFNFPDTIADEHRRYVEKVVTICPAVNSLNKEITKNFSFAYSK